MPNDLHSVAGPACTAEMLLFVILAISALLLPSLAAASAPSIYLPLILSLRPASVTPTPTATAEPGVCECWGNLYNCSDFDTQVEAQACHDYCVDAEGFDVHRLDRDRDGLACESLP